jgi:hypothetical protein
LIPEVRAFRCRAGCAARAESCLRCSRARGARTAPGDEQRDDGHLHRLAFVVSCSRRVPAVEHLHVREHDFGRRLPAVVGLAVATRRRGARQHVAGHADHFVHAHRHGAHARRDDRRQAGPASFDASFAAESASFLTTDTIRPRSTIACGSSNAPSGDGGRRPVEVARSSRRSSPSERQVAFATTTVPGRHAHRLDGHVLQIVIRAVRQTAAGKDGHQEHGKNSHASHRVTSSKLRERSRPRSPDR